ncbi:GntR family transcriptional regulator [soil metagenome]
MKIDPESSTPPYEQVRLQLLEQVTSGTLAPGTKLPTVRGLADELGIAANTVARAYRELETDHVIETRGRIGSFVAASEDPTLRAAQDAARAYADRLRHLGLTDAAALDLVRAALAR